MKKFIEMDKTKVQIYQRVQNLSRDINLNNLKAKRFQNPTKRDVAIDLGIKKIKEQYKEKVKGDLANQKRSKSNVLPVSSDKLLHDRTIMQFVGQKAEFREEAFQVQSMKMQERMLVNLLQCFIKSGLVDLQEYAINKLLETYLEI